jgi:hypothetical protein
MKSVVAELTGRDAVLLNEDGSFTRSANRGYRIGMQVESPAQAVRFPVKLRWVVSIAAALLMLVGTPAFAYFTSYSYVSVDINPSITLRANVFNRVIGVAALNPEGESLLQNVQLINLEISQAVRRIVSEAAAEGYIQKNSYNGIVIAVASNQDARADEQAAAAVLEAEDALAEDGEEGDVLCEPVGYDMVRDAQALGISAGKLSLILQYLEAAGPNAGISTRDLAGKPVREIMQMLNEALAAAAQGGSQSGDAGAAHQGDETAQESGDSAHDAASDLAPADSQGGISTAAGDSESSYDDSAMQESHENDSEDAEETAEPHEADD